MVKISPQNELNDKTTDNFQKMIKVPEKYLKILERKHNKRKKK